MATALFIGRFQPFHNGHLKAIEFILSRQDRLAVAIGSAQESMTWDNPFSARERLQMLGAVLGGRGLAGKITLVPVPDVNDNARWVSHVTSLVPKYECAYSNNPLVRELFAKAQVKIFDTSSFDRERLEGTKIRELMAASKPWRDRVPPEIAGYLELIGAESRLKKLKK